MSFKQKQKLIVCIVFILVLLSLLIGYPSDVVDQNSQLHEALSEAEIIQLEAELTGDRGFKAYQGRNRGLFNFL